MNTIQTRDPERIFIFDTTLRDGQQSPGAGMSYENNLAYAQKAAELGVDILEAGFPSASRHDFLIVRDIAKMLAGMEHGPVICGLCQAREDQVLSTIDALQPAQPYGTARVHIYLPVDPELMEASLGSRSRDKGRLLRDVADLVKKAAQAGMQVEFSPEGYSHQRGNFDFTTDLIRAAVNSGATIINCPDTRGIASPIQREDYFVYQMRRHADIISEEYPNRSVIWSTHNHNDLGLATINSLNAVYDGPARQIECTINGVGERAGNASLEQVAVNIKVHAPHQFYTGIVTDRLQSLSDFVNDHMLPRQPHGPLVHKNSFCHSSGGHTNAIIARPDVYHVIDPKTVGGSITLCFGPLSGSNHAQDIIEKAGYRCSDAERAQICQYIKDYYVERRKGVTDTEVLAAYMIFRSPIRAEELGYNKTPSESSLYFRGTFFGSQGDLEFKGDRNDSALAALKAAIELHMPEIEIEDYTSRSLGQGIHASSEATIDLKAYGKSYRGTASHTDLEISALHALVAAANAAYIEHHFRVGNGVHYEI